MTIPEDIVVELIIKFKEDTNCTQLATLYGYNRKLISAVLKQNGVHVQRGYTDDIINQAIGLYHEGHSIRHIAQILNVDRNQLSQQLEKMGIRNKPDPNNKAQIFIENDETVSVKNRYLQGVSIKNIAKELNRSTNYVQRILQRYNVVQTDRPPKKYHMTWRPFYDINTQEQAYWLGFIMADGSVNISLSRYTLDFGLMKKDQDRVQALADFIRTEPALPVKERIVYPNFAPEGCCQVRLCVYDMQMVKDLISWGCVPRKSLTKKFPWKLQQHLWRHFIRGYFDGNGYVSYNGGQLRFGFTSSFDMCQAIECILISEDIVHHHVQFNSHGKATGFVHGGNKQARSFFDYLYCQATTYMKRKYNVFNAVLNESHK